MRAYDIAFALIILQATIGFVNGLGLFEHPYYATPENEYTKYKVEDLKDYKKIADNPSVLDYMALSVNLLWEGFVMFLKVVFAVIVILPILIDIFGVPVGLASLIQVGIYVIYFMGWTQWKSNKGLRYYE